MAKYPGLMRRGTKWYLRVSVPGDLVDAIGKREVWRSLRTGDHREAKRRYFEERAKVERQFGSARQGLDALSEQDIRRMVVQWFDQGDRRSAKADFAALGGGRQVEPDDAGEWEGMLLGGADEEILPHVQAEADAILISHGWPRSTRQATNIGRWWRTFAGRCWKKSAGGKLASTVASWGMPLTRCSPAPVPGRGHSTWQPGTKRRPRRR